MNIKLSAKRFTFMMVFILTGFIIGIGTAWGVYSGFTQGYLGRNPDELARNGLLVIQIGSLAGIGFLLSGIVASLIGMPIWGKSATQPHG
jgi:hypothetical protein